jgi:hypothetical protein
MRIGGGGGNVAVADVLSGAEGVDLSCFLPTAPAAAAVVATYQPFAWGREAATTAVPWKPPPSSTVPTGQATLPSAAMEA